MNSLQVLSPLPSSSSATASTRSPSPDLPGAWPRTPSRHKRSQTCPVLTPAPMPKTTSPADMHLDRVVNFHQRLSLSLSGECEETNSPFVQPHFLASAVSDLTNCNTVQQDPESPLFADTSWGSSSFSMTPESLHQPTPASEFSIPRIRMHRGASSDKQGDLSSLTSVSKTALSLPSPISPMVFNTPSPNGAHALHAITTPSLPGMSSSSSISSEGDYFNYLRTDTSNVNTTARRLDHSQRVSPSVDELAPPSIPMLTALSLPGTPEDSLMLGSSRSARNPPDDYNEGDWTLSLSAMTPSTSHSILPPSPSVSPASSFQTRLHLDAPEHLVDFPQPSPLASSLNPSPALPLPSDEGDVEDFDINVSLATSAAEYAAAVMSSAWTFENPQLPPVSLEIPQQSDDSTDRHQPQQTIGKRSLLTRVKKLGGKFRTLLGRGSKREMTEEMRRSHSVTSIRTTTEVYTSERPRLPSLGLIRLDLESESVLPPTPRTIAETNMRRLSTRFPLANTSNPNTLPEIQVLPPSVPNSPALPSTKSTIAQIAQHARPKTLAEIKSSRRFSLSAMTNLSRPMSPPSPPPILVASRRRRPVSARLALPRRQSLRFEQDGEVRRPVSRSSKVDPPGLELPRSTSRPGSSTAVVPPINVQERTGENVAQGAKDLKKSRRFSLSALSSLASGGGGGGGSGLREDGSSGWARPSGRF